LRRRLFGGVTVANARSIKLLGLMLGLATALGCKDNGGVKRLERETPRPRPQSTSCLDNDGDGLPGTGDCTALAQQDCNDRDPTVRPHAEELCDGQDNDCDGEVDEALGARPYFIDLDGDGFGSTEAGHGCGRLPEGMVASAGDCNDDSRVVKPGAAEACNNVDDNCNGATDEGNPGGGASCNSGQGGICSSGVITCQTGALTCLRRVAPSPELCNDVDDDCDNQVDQTFANKGQGCTVGLGVCNRTGTYVCSADARGTQCSARPGAASPPACDGIDNDCDGVVDDPYLSGSADLTSNVAWADVEHAPYYFSNSGCAGGANGSGNDALKGGAVVMAGGTPGLGFYRLDDGGAPQGALVTLSSLNYADVGIAQAGDQYLVAGIYLNDQGLPVELDLYLVEAATGLKRAVLESQFNTGNRLDSLRVVRGNGRRVVLLWREEGVGIKLARVEPVTGSTAIKVVNTLTLVSNPGVAAGLGADSTHADWVLSQACAAVSSLRKMRVAYLPTQQSLRFFDFNEDGSGQGNEVELTAVLGTSLLGEPEVAHFRASNADQWFHLWTTANGAASPPDEDLSFWLTTDSTESHPAFDAVATALGADSIRRPRASVGPSRIWLTALRAVADPTPHKLQVMIRKVDYSGNKDPANPSVEVSPTQGGCGAEPSCRPGTKEGLVSWATKDRLYFSGSVGGSAPGATWAASLGCQ
jgi:hypothetical protein